jgi:hypothetical protein
MYSLIRVFIVAAFIISPIESHAASLSPEETADHIGEIATVCGLVVSTTYLPQAPQAPTFLDLGKPYPNQIFSAIIFGSDRPKFGAPETSMRDKPVCTGLPVKRAVREVVPAAPCRPARDLASFWVDWPIRCLVRFAPSRNIDGLEPLAPGPLDVAHDAFLRRQIARIP